MSIDKATVARIATLARIRIDSAEQERLAGELSKIFDFVEQLGEVDTSKVEPMTSVVEMALPWRADEVTDGGYADKVLANAPQTEHGYFTVPKVIE